MSDREQQAPQVKPPSEEKCPAPPRTFSDEEFEVAKKEVFEKYRELFRLLKDA